MSKYKIGKGLQKAARTGALAVAALESAKAVKAGQVPTTVEDAGKMALEFLIITAVELVRNWLKVKWGLFGKR